MSDNTSLESIFRLVHSLKRQMSEQIESLDSEIAPMNIRVMKIITKKSPCTAIDIAHYLNRDKAQVTRLVNALINQELVKKSPNPEDKRSQLLILTNKGQEVMSKVSDIDRDMLKRMTKGMAEDELEQFRKIAKKMAQNLEN
ncbi:MarR family transcriptional regulator [Vibrio crassostreae]|uniref:Transcriptional regulator, MarR family protein n=2 Tax=Vibrio crassostreae TaxID=246167 RepID=A0A0T7DSQ5_9VIBR|nr:MULTISPECIES: MarR family winged helix-turn-helix transcriptional regulator [Vibrio]MDH5952523.1 MarR family winged helix-turn-helix transcriptional regulator [Vibrio crassostreae]NOH76258.1 winged helix-turn-helix transcriptional regulator [Vibrio crassostreae]NOI53624.1 winged helix-turn-helix transcriptional regulator [Vibrio crassostreae]PME37445.1 MarR family transcriptional regulator [Vibrio sp. 10N.286.55.E10]PME43368.1 MarR family transcriptional regulator [Vibrio sp. 10N.286.55.E12